MTGSTRATMMAAFFRSAWSAIAAAALSGLTAYQVMDGTMSDESAVKKALVVAGISFFGPFVTRAGVEGIYDARRQQSGDRTPADVTSTPT